jgi:hypothetical protein
VRRALAPVAVRASAALAVAPPVATIEVPPVRLRERQAESSTAYDLVRRVAGVEVHEQGQGPGFTANVVVRGFTSDHAADVLLTIDGVPINLPMHGHVEGYADWNLLLPAAVQSMRLIAGTASPLHGDFALGGVMEVFTAADAAGPQRSLSATSVGDVRGGWRTGRRRSASGWALTAQGEQQQGWRVNDDARLATLSLRGWRAARGGRLEGGLLAYGSQWASPGFVPVLRYNASALRDAIDPTDGGHATRFIGHLRYSRLLGTASLETTAWAQAVRSRLWLHIPEPGLALGQSQETDARGLAGVQAQLGWRVAGGETTVGVTARTDLGAYTLFDSEARVAGAQTVGYDARYAAAAGYARWRRLVGARLGVDLGARLDAVQYASDNRLTTDGWARGRHLIPSPKLGLRYLLGTHWALTASSSRGFRGALGVIGDPGRAPFLAWSHETGARYSRGAVDGRLALFRTDVSNERIQDPVTRQVSSVGRSRRQGIDGVLSVALGRGPWLSAAGRTEDVPRLRLLVGGTWNDARLRPLAATGVVDTAGGARAASGARLDRQSLLDPATLVPRQHEGPHAPPLSGQRVPGVSRYTGRVEGALVVRTGTTVAATWRAFGPFIPISEPDVETRAASVLDLAVSLPAPGPLGRGAHFDLALTNALGVRYVENRAAGFVTPGLPRQLRVGVRWGGATTPDPLH